MEYNTPHKKLQVFFETQPHFVGFWDAPGDMFEFIFVRLNTKNLKKHNKPFPFSHGKN